MLVSYVYGDGLRHANGRCITHAGELPSSATTHDEFTCYVVEVCPDCQWNHLGAASSTAAATTRRRPAVRASRATG